MASMFDLRQLFRNKIWISRTRRTHLIRLESAVDKNLISWTLSRSHEKAAETVLCLSPNLIWAQLKIGNILDDVRRDARKKYRYIVFDNKIPGNAEAALDHAVHIIDAAQEDDEIRRNNNIEIAFLTKEGRTNCVWSAREGRSTRTSPADWRYLPIPTDIAIYQNTLTEVESKSSRTRTTFAVMSVKPINEYLADRKVASLTPEDLAVYYKDLKGLKLDENYEFDVTFRHEDLYKPIEQWFNKSWR